MSCRNKIRKTHTNSQCYKNSIKLLSLTCKNIHGYTVLAISMFSHCVYIDTYTLRHIIIAAPIMPLYLKILSGPPLLIAIFRQLSNLAAKIHFYVKLDIICDLSRTARVSIKRKKRERKRDRLAGHFHHL